MANQILIKRVKRYCTKRLSVRCVYVWWWELHNKVRFLSLVLAFAFVWRCGFVTCIEEKRDCDGKSKKKVANQYSTVIDDIGYLMDTTQKVSKVFSTIASLYLRYLWLLKSRPACLIPVRLLLCCCARTVHYCTKDPSRLQELFYFSSSRNLLM